MIFDSLFLSVLFYIILVLVVMIGIFFIVFDDGQLIFWYLFHRKTLKFKLIRKLVKEEQEIYILGSLHHMHYHMTDFSFQHLKAVLSNLKPHVLLVESRQEEIDRDNLADGPIEMFYLHMAAKALNIPVKGIDWFSYEKSKPGTTNRKRDKMMTEKIIESSKGHHKVLVVVGATHMLVESKMLKRNGYKKEIIAFQEKEALFSSPDKDLVFPEATLNYVNKRIAIEKEKLETMDMTKLWKKATERLIFDLEEFTKKIENNQFSIES